MKIEASIFDMDGTLMDTEILWVKSMETFLGKVGHPVTRAQSLELVYGISWRDIYHNIIEHFPDLAMSVDDMAGRIRPYFLRLKRDCDVQIPNSIALLKSLSQKMPVCIVSGSSRADIEDGIHAMKIEEHIRFFLGAEDYSPGKPDPVCYQMAAEKLGKAAEHCLVFEDSSAGVRAAKAAGMTCVALKRQRFHELDLSPADLVLEDLGDFTLAEL